jgi:hypothetical protein
MLEKVMIAMKYSYFNIGKDRLKDKLNAHSK